MYNLIEKKRCLIDEKVKKMEENWKIVFFNARYYTYLSDTERASDIDEKWDTIQNLGRELSTIKWDNDIEYLKKQQAKSNYWLGSIYSEYGQHDHACKFLEKAKELMETYSFIYSMPDCYIHTNLFLIISYIEKHHDWDDINLCYEKIENLLEGNDTSNLLELDPLIVQRLQIEQNMQKVIIKNERYNMGKDKNEKNTTDPSDNSDDPKKSVKSILEYIEQELKKIQLSEDHPAFITDSINDNRQWLLKYTDTYFASKGIYYKNLYFYEKNQIPPKVNDKNPIQKYFMNAISAFLEGLIHNHKSTICSGNIAALLFECTTVFDSKCPDLEKSQADSFDLTVLKNQISEILMEKQKTENSTQSEIVKEIQSELQKDNTLQTIIDFFLGITLKADPNNMFALSLKAIHKSNTNPKELETYPYPALRQCSLRRYFKKLDKSFPWEKNSYPTNSKKKILDASNPDKLESLKMSILELYMIISDYISKAIYPRDQLVNLKVGHYTKSWVLPKLLNSKDSSKLRIQNVKHLNDPSEGALFMGYIKELKEQKEQEDPSDPNPQDETLIQNILQLYDYKQNENCNQKCSVYMGCFSSRTDQLNMWSRYGEQGKGCCLCIDAKASFDDHAPISFGEISEGDDEQKFKLEDSFYPLYMVVYLPGNTKADLYAAAEYAKMRSDAEDKRIKIFENQKRIDEFSKESLINEYKQEANWWKYQATLIRKFKDMTETVNENLRKIQSIYDELINKSSQTEPSSFIKFRKELTNIIMMILDQVRFLVKDEAYRDEREYRVIQFSHTPQYNDTENQIPKLYIDIEKDLVYDSVCFGPLTQNFASDSAFVLNLQRKSALENKKNNHDITVHKSQIPYWC